MTTTEGVEVTVTDLGDGDRDTATVLPGDYCLVVTRPLRLTHTRRYANGTVVLTLKREEADGA